MCSPTTYNTVLSPDLTMDWGVAAGAMCVRLSWTTAGTRAWMGLGFGTQMDGSTPVITVNPGTGASIDTYVNGPTGTQPTTTTSYTISMESATAGGSGGLSSTWLRSAGFNPTGLNNMVWANGQTLASGHTPTTRGTICLDASTGNVVVGNCPAVSTTGSPAGGTTGSPAGTTGSPAGTTGAPAGTTGVPAGTTGSPAGGTTGAPAGTTGAPAGTTGAPAGTTGVPATTTGVASTTGVAGSTTGTTTGAAGNGTSTTGNSTAPSPPSSPAPSPSPPSSPAPTPASSTSDAPVGLATSATVAVTALTAAVALF